MRYFDLHCDTLYRALNEKGSLNNNEFEVFLSANDKFKSWAQCFAIWLPDSLSVNKARSMFFKAASELSEEAAENGFQLYRGGSFGKSTAVFTVENGKLIGNDLDMIKRLAEYGVKMLTLTWNGDNTIACGALTENDKGISDFGTMAVRELEKQKIIIDASHLSDKSFYGLARISKKPFVASHSNSRAVCDNRRNLTDGQFALIRDRGGIVGLNFHRFFLNKDGNASIKDVAAHLEHFLSLGGENTVAIGSDFDGSDIPCDIKNILGIERIYEYLLRLNYSEELLDKLFWTNAANFFETFDNR